MVVVKVLTPEECNESVDDIWNYVEEFLKKRKKNIDRNDPTTWNDWLPMADEGILGLDPVFTHQALKIRENEKIYQVFSNLLETPNLMVNHDR